MLPEWIVVLGLLAVMLAAYAWGKNERD